ncbi:hypothetical protein AAC387_Pa12g1209 [Persea americana]
MAPAFGRKFVVWITTFIKGAPGSSVMVRKSTSGTTVGLKQFSSLISDLSPNVEVSDSLRWRDSPDGPLSLHAAGQIIRSRADIFPSPKLIWNNISLHKINCFGWRLMHYKTPPKIRLKRLGFRLLPDAVFVVLMKTQLLTIFSLVYKLNPAGSSFFKLLGFRSQLCSLPRKSG